MGVLLPLSSRSRSVASSGSGDTQLERSVLTVPLAAEATALFLRGQSLMLSGVVFPLCLGDGVQGSPVSVCKGQGVLEGQWVGVQDWQMYVCPLLLPGVLCEG